MMGRSSRRAHRRPSPAAGARASCTWENVLRCRRMALETKLYQKLSQQLVMTPQLRQAIKILQVSRAELETLIDEELTENPVLEENLDEKVEGPPEVPTVDGQNGAEEWQATDGEKP